MPSIFTRRKSDVVIDDIFAATYQMLQTQCFKDITFKRVKKAAQVSRSVIHHYWINPLDLSVATIDDWTQNDEQCMQSLEFDNGSLRADLIYAGNQFADYVIRLPDEFNRILIIELQHQDWPTKKLLKATHRYALKLMRKTTKLAKKRGEIKQNVKLPITTKLVLFQLICYQNYLSGQPVSSEMITHWVDDIVLPVIAKENQRLLIVS